MLYMTVIQITKWDKDMTFVTVMVTRSLNVEKIIEDFKTNNII